MCEKPRIQSEFWSVLPTKPASKEPPCEEEWKLLEDGDSVWQAWVGVGGELIVLCGQADLSVGEGGRGW